MLKAFTVGPDGSVALSLDGTEVSAESVSEGILTVEEVAYLNSCVEEVIPEGYTFKDESTEVVDCKVVVDTVPVNPELNPEPETGV